MEHRQDRGRRHRHRARGAAYLPAADRARQPQDGRVHGRRSGDHQAGVESAFEQFPILYERRDMRAVTLSGGEQQMLAIARALMTEPRLLCLDEPSMGLSPILVQQVFEIIQKINEERGTTIFMVEQNASMALGVAHRGYVLQNGRIVAADEACNLLADEAIKQAYLGG
ncbi:MAG: ATP-binding cassette domain-containing protein [Thermoleophilia bacterium]|nr:ATP-binding cassette domain-containing protein [Thermoleophilia bacterium]